MKRLFNLVAAYALGKEAWWCMERGWGFPMAFFIVMCAIALYMAAAKYPWQHR